MASTFKLIALAIVAILAMVGAGLARDLAYQVNALIVLAVSVGMFLWVLRGVGEPARAAAAPAHDRGYMDDVIRAGVIATAGWGVV
ncbi:MAG: cytochrome-c oxidase, cbb3-type subunit I, partial [Pseudomonadota bacterium]|nr:cytochrome-c oxidase, cbb3-type subunit I [Pseudomonadota bacterium]